jgi:hypothetical protein
MHQNADFPYKSRKNKLLDAEEKEYNTALSSTFLATSKRLKLSLMAIVTKLNVTP